MNFIKLCLLTLTLLSSSLLGAHDTLTLKNCILSIERFPMHNNIELSDDDKQILAEKGYTIRELADDSEANNDLSVGDLRLEYEVSEGFSSGWNSKFAEAHLLLKQVRYMDNDGTHRNQICRSPVAVCYSGPYKMAVAWAHLYNIGNKAVGRFHDLSTYRLEALENFAREKHEAAFANLPSCEVKN